MKILLSLMVLGLLAGCATSTPRILVKNCQPMGSGLYSCEEIPQKDIEPRK